MNQMDRAMHELGEMDELAARRSPIHSLSPLTKLLTTITYLICVVSFGKYDLSGLTVMALYPVVLFQLSGIPARACFYKLRFMLPLVMAVGVLNPLLDRSMIGMIGTMPISGGVVSMLTLMCKGVLCLTASFLLMATTSIDALCAALRKLHFPAMAVTLLLLTYRYVGVMTREIAVMTDAYRLRAPGQKGIHFSAWGSFLGQALLRTMDRGAEIYSAMELRGFRGEFYYAQSAQGKTGDWIYGAVWICLFFLARWVNVAQLLGRVWVR